MRLRSTKSCSEQPDDVMSQIGNSGCPDACDTIWDLSTTSIRTIARLTKVVQSLTNILSRTDYQRQAVSNVHVQVFWGERIHSQQLNIELSFASDTFTFRSPADFQSPLFQEHTCSEYQTIEEMQMECRKEKSTTSSRHRGKPTDKRTGMHHLQKMSALSDRSARTTFLPSP
jgi:hypothetical protein